MAHDYFGCTKNLEDCRWCLMRAEKLCEQHGFDVQELDHQTTFAEQNVIQLIQESQDDGIHNLGARQLMGLEKMGTKKKPKPMKIGDILDGLEYLGAKADE